MGNYSYLIITTGGAESCTIDWGACQFNYDEIKHGEGYHITIFKDETPDKRPKTIADLAKELHNHKLFGYLDNGYIGAIREVCLRTTDITGQCLMPRIYFEEEGWLRLHYLEFMPGTTTVIHGTFSFEESDLPKTGVNEDDDEEEEMSREAIDRYEIEKREILLGFIHKIGWRVNHLVQVDESKRSALPTLMALFGIRPEDLGSMEQASKYIDVKKAMDTPLSSLFSAPH